MAWIDRTFRSNLQSSFNWRLLFWEQLSDLVELCSTTRRSYYFIHLEEGVLESNIIVTHFKVVNLLELVFKYSLAELANFQSSMPIKHSKQLHALLPIKVRVGYVRVFLVESPTLHACTSKGDCITTSREFVFTFVRCIKIHKRSSHYANS